MRVFSTTVGPRKEVAEADDDGGSVDDKADGGSGHLPLMSTDSNSKNVSAAPSASSSGRAQDGIKYE